MTATGHSVMGVALAAAIPNPYLGIPIAILSHIACDAFPHWYTGTNMPNNNPKSKKTRLRFVTESVFDLVLSLTVPLLLMYYLFPHLNPLYMYSMVIAAQGFDWATAPALFLKWKFPPFSTAYWLQGTFDHRLDRPLGVILQIIVLIAFLFIAKISLV